MSIIFNLESCDKESKARAGVIFTQNHKITTPVFMPVGTQATVKGLTSQEIKDLNYEIILSNAYHLYLKPGIEIIKKFGGLHKFMNWDLAILTDSGGYQIFSMAPFVKVNQAGIQFQSHLNGSYHFLTPEDIIKIQEILKAEIIMPLDECLLYHSDYDKILQSLELSAEWARRSKKVLENSNQSLFGIIHGGLCKDLRKKSLDMLVEIGFDGYAIGGLSVGEEKKFTLEIIEFIAPLMPFNKPRYLMGMGSPLDILEAISHGIDMFDCTIPTRNGRNGTVFTSFGKLIVKNAYCAYDFSPLDSSCSCFVCQNYSRAYLRHLFNSGEFLGGRLTSYHNLYFYKQLMNNARRAILEKRFISFKQEFERRYLANS